MKVKIIEEAPYALFALDEALQDACSYMKSLTNRLLLKRLGCLAVQCQDHQDDISSSLQESNLAKTAD